MRHHVTTTDVLWKDDCQFYLLCEILYIYRSPAYVYWGLKLVSVTRALHTCGTYICIHGPTFFQSCNFQSRIFSPAFSGPAFSTPAFSTPAFLVLHFPVLHFPVLHFPVPHFPVLHFGPSNLTSLVPHFPVPHFPRPPCGVSSATDVAEKAALTLIRHGFRAGLGRWQ